jgi:ribosomal protein S18 acetylase RimI-like enzyme
MRNVRQGANVTASGSANRPIVAPEIETRAAQTADQAFALALYLEGPNALLAPLGKWDERRFIERFHQVFQPGLAQIIMSGDARIGWLRVTDSAESLHLNQIHLVEACRSRGIGARLMLDLQDRARRLGKPLTLRVMRGNDRALAFYLRLGFRIVSEDKERVSMRWDGRPATA